MKSFLLTFSLDFFYRPFLSNFSLGTFYYYKTIQNFTEDYINYFIYIYKYSIFLNLSDLNSLQTTPFLFILMSRKTRRAYEHLFNYLKKNIIDLGNGSSIMTDFECAMRNALRSVFPQIELNCCWFHFTQAAKKRAMQTPQLMPHLLKNEKAREIYYKLLSLPLLPANDIVPQFQRLKILALSNNRNVFKDFIKYYENQWM